MNASKPLDNEWVSLMKAARQIGCSVDEVRSFIAQPEAYLSSRQAHVSTEMKIPK